jgi:hypothetical protein
MEATGVYWKPVWHVLEGAIELLLVNAKHEQMVEALRGYVTDLHRFDIRLHLDLIDALDRALGTVDQRLEVALDPFS